MPKLTLMLRLNALFQLSDVGRNQRIYFGQSRHRMHSNKPIKLWSTCMKLMYSAQCDSHDSCRLLELSIDDSNFEEQNNTQFLTKSLLSSIISSSLTSSLCLTFTPSSPSFWFTFSSISSSSTSSAGSWSIGLSSRVSSKGKWIATLR